VTATLQASRPRNDPAPCRASPPTSTRVARPRWGRGESVAVRVIEDLPSLARPAATRVDRGFEMVAATPPDASSGSRRGVRRGPSQRRTARGRAAGAAGAAVVAVALLAAAGRAREGDGEGSGTVPISGRGGGGGLSGHLATRRSGRKSVLAASRRGGGVRLDVCPDASGSLATGPRRRPSHDDRATAGRRGGSLGRRGSRPRTPRAGGRGRRGGRWWSWKCGEWRRRWR